MASYPIGSWECCLVLSALLSYFLKRSTTFWDANYLKTVITPIFYQNFIAHSYTFISVKLFISSSSIWPPNARNLDRRSYMILHLSITWGLSPFAIVDRPPLIFIFHGLTLYWLFNALIYGFEFIVYRSLISVILLECSISFAI